VSAPRPTIIRTPKPSNRPGTSPAGLSGESTMPGVAEQRHRERALDTHQRDVGEVRADCRRAPDLRARRPPRTRSSGPEYHPERHDADHPRARPERMTADGAQSLGERRHERTRRVVATAIRSPAGIGEMRLGCIPGTRPGLALTEQRKPKTGRGRRTWVAYLSSP
jgi:hypothetical protein